TPIDFNPSRTIVSLSHLVTEWRLIKRLQTRGGERWPVGGVGDATRVSPSAVQAALASGVPRRTPGPPDGQGSRVLSEDAGPSARALNGGVSRPGKRVRRDERSTTGNGAEQTSNIARGTPWDLADLPH